MDVSVKITGAEDAAAKLRALVPTMRKKVLRNALAAGARLVRDDAKRNAPVLSASVKAPYRSPGTLKGAIKVRTSKAARKAGNVGVFVNVKPATGAARGAKSGKDPFYWRFQEFGWTPASSRAGFATKVQRRQARRRGAAAQIPGKKFLRNAASRLKDALDIFTVAVNKWIAKANATAKVEP